MRQAAFQPEPVEEFQRLAAHGFRRLFRQQGRQADVFEHVQGRQQVEGLKDHPHHLPPEAREVRTGRVGQVVARHHELAGGGMVQPGQQGQQRALPGAAVALEHHELAGGDVQVDLVDAGHGAVAERVGAGQFAGVNDRFS